MEQTHTLLHNRYSIVHIERTSNFSKIFFALDTYQNPPRNCVIKLFEPTVRKTEVIEWIEQEFQKEAKRLKQLSLVERHLPEIYTYYSQSQACYLVRELIEGETTSKKVLIQGAFSVTKVREILIKLLSVLKHLHQRKIIHQNIQPQNIILRTEDYFPMLINFGSIKQIVATYGFCGDKHLFANNNAYGYAPPEQTLGHSVPSSDLYSLGLTAIYLLVAKHPIDLAVDADSGKIKIPQSILLQDYALAKVLTKAISPNLSDRYGSAEEMLDDLQSQKSHLSDHQLPKNQADFVPFQQQDYPNPKNWWKIAIYVVSIVCVVSAGIIAWYDWSLSQNPTVRSLPEPTVASPINPPKPPQIATTRPSMLNNQGNNLIEIPILAVGTSKEELRKTLGEPNSIQKGYWKNSSAWIYKNRANNSIDLGYLFDLDTDDLRQTEVAISPSVGLGTMEEILTSLLQGQITPSISQKLQAIYNQEDQAYSFKLNNLEGSIEREPDNHIYLGVWEADFH